MKNLNLENGDLKIESVIFSVWEKNGIENFARELREINAGMEIFGTPGSRDHMRSHNLENIRCISEITKEKPASFKHRMSSISYPYTSSIIFNREDPDQIAEAQELGIEGRDMVICTLYPFEKTLAEERAKGTSGLELMKIAIEKIDVGGPCMVRAAAKNYRGVVIVTNYNDLQCVIDEMKGSGGFVSHQHRLDLSIKAFRLASEYDAAIYKFLEEYLAEYGHLNLPW